MIQCFVIGRELFAKSRVNRPVIGNKGNTK